MKFGLLGVLIACLCLSACSDNALRDALSRWRTALEGMPEPWRRFAEIVLANYVQDGVWKLNRATFTDVLNQLYHGNMPAALADLGFAKPADALGFFGNIQQQLYAA